MSDLVRCVANNLFYGFVQTMLAFMRSCAGEQPLGYAFCRIGYRIKSMFAVFRPQAMLCMPLRCLRRPAQCALYSVDSNCLVPVRYASVGLTASEKAQLADEPAKADAAMFVAFECAALCDAV